MWTGASVPSGSEGLLANKHVLVTGVLTESSLASAVARLALTQGADVLLTSPLCRAWPVTSRVGPRLGVSAPVLELDVTAPADLAGLAAAVQAAGWSRVDGVLHAIAYLPGAPGLLAQSWDAVAETFQTTAWSLAAVTNALRPLLARGASVVGLDLDAGRAWPGQDWLGVAQGALESVCRYLARDLGPAGVRVNLVASGPQRTLLARAIPHQEELAQTWAARAPLGWDAADAEPVARACVALLSDWFPKTTGSIVHVDGGFSAVGV